MNTVVVHSEIELYSRDANLWCNN